MLMAGSAASAQGLVDDSPWPATDAADEGLSYALEGTRWRLVGYQDARDARDGEAMSPVPPGVAARLTLRAGSGRAGVGCGPIRLEYSLAEPPAAPVASPSVEPSQDLAAQSDAQASLAPRVSPREGVAVADPTPGASAARTSDPLRFVGVTPAERPCPVPSAAVEKVLVEALASAARFVIEPASDAWQAHLRIHDAEGQERLSFRVDDAWSLDSGQWLLPIAGTDPAVLSFDPSHAGRRSRGRVLGSTGCNSLSARYVLEGRVLGLRGLQTSDLGCPPALADDEARILAVLGAPSLLVDLPPARLVLHDPASGERLELASDRPLEGPTWLLSRLAGRELAGVTVTLRVEDGRLSGEGPCGPYSGAYRTNGLLLEVSDVGAGERACPRRSLERAWLRALRRTASVDARGPGLVLVDALGDALATLRRPGAF